MMFKHPSQLKKPRFTSSREFDPPPPPLPRGIQDSVGSRSSLSNPSFEKSWLRA